MMSTWLKNIVERYVHRLAGSAGKKYGPILHNGGLTKCIRCQRLVPETYYWIRQPGRHLCKLCAMSKLARMNILEINTTFQKAFRKHAPEYKKE